MNDEERTIIADKIKNKTATEEETILFINEFTRLVAELNKKLESE
jgi:hypothetical protein